MTPAPAAAASPEPAGGPATAPRSGLPRATLILAAVLAIFFSPVLFTRGTFTFRDMGRMHYPEKSFIAGELRQGHLPQWNPYMGLGVPLVATAVDAPLHPFNLLLAVLPFEAAFKAWVLLSYLLGGTGAFVWARRLGLSFTAGLGCSLAFALSGFLVSSSDNATYLTAAASVPWLLAAGEGWYRRGGPLRLGLLGAASWLCAAAGDPQGWGFAVGILGLRGLWLARAPGGRGRAVGRAVLAGLVSAVAAAPLLVPVVLWMPFSRRAAGLEEVTAQRWNLHPLRLLEFLLPSILESKAWGTLSGGVFGAFAANQGTPIPWIASIYLGISTLALAALGGWKSRQARVMLAASAVLTWAAMGHWAGFVQVVRDVPVLGQFRYWEKLTVWPTLFVAASAGIGLEHLLADRGRAGRFARVVAGAAAVLLVAWTATRILPLERWLARPGVTEEDVLQLVENVRRATGFTTLVLMLTALAALAFARGMLGRAAPLAFVSIVAFDVASANVRAYVLSPPETVQSGPILTGWLQARPELPRVVAPYDLSHKPGPGYSPFEAVWKWGALTYAHAWHVASRVGNIDVYTGLNPERVSTYRLTAKLDRLVPQVGLWGFRYLVVPGRPENASFLRLDPPFDVVAADPGNRIYLVQFAHRPRAYLADQVASVDAAGALEFTLDRASVTSRRTVIEAPLPGPAVDAPPGEARITAASTDEVSVEVDALRPALLVLNDQAAPGWRALVDGTERPIVTANYLARGVWVEAGRHRVVFRYRTPGLLPSSAAIGVGLLALLGWGAVRRRRAPAV